MNDKRKGAQAPSKGPSSSKELSTDVQGTDLIERGTNLPAYIKNDGKARGNETVKSEDLVVPRLEIVQGLSPCVDERNEAAYIPGAKVGMLFNSLTRQLYGRSAIVIPVLFTKQYLLWKDRDEGGGFRGAYPTLAEAEIIRKQQEEPELWEAHETAQHLCLIASAGGRVEEIMVSMSRTKLKISRQWNSMIKLAGGDRFSRAYELTTQPAQNDKGDKYENFLVKPAGFPKQALYEQAERLYASVTSGQTVIEMDTSDLDAGGEGGTAGNDKDSEY